MSVPQEAFLRTSSSRKVIGIKNVSIRELLVDPIQIFQHTIPRIVWQIVRRITIEILGVKGCSDK